MRCGILIEKNQFWIKLFDDSPFNECKQEEGIVIILNKKSVPKLIKQLKDAFVEDQNTTNKVGDNK